jgi:hypothetical protein
MKVATVIGMLVHLVIVSRIKLQKNLLKDTDISTGLSFNKKGGSNANDLTQVWKCELGECKLITDDFSKLKNYGVVSPQYNYNLNIMLEAGA